MMTKLELLSIGLIALYIAVMVISSLLEVI